jgi:hypothetical protein
MVKRDTPCKAILLALEMDTPCTSMLMAVEMDTPCTYIYTDGGGRGDTLYVHTDVGYALQSSILLAVEMDAERGYDLQGNFAG